MDKLTRGTSVVRFALLAVASACTSPEPAAEVPATPYGDYVSDARGIACIDGSHAAVATKTGLSIYKLVIGASVTLVATLPADQRVDLNQAYFLVAPGRLYFLNRTYGVLHVVDTSNLDAPKEIAAIDGAPLPSVAAATGTVVYQSDPQGIVAVDMADPNAPIRGAVMKIGAFEQPFTFGAATPLALVGTSLLVLSADQLVVEAIDVSNPMAPQSTAVVPLATTDAASKQVIANGWTVFGQRLYIGTVQKPSLPTVKLAAPASPYVIDISNPASPRLAARPTASRMMRIAGAHPKWSVYGIFESSPGNPSYPMSTYGRVYHLDVTNPDAPTQDFESIFYWAESTQVDAMAIQSVCFAGDTIVSMWGNNGLKAAFAAVKSD